MFTLIKGGLVHIREVWSKMLQIQTACNTRINGRMFSRAVALRDQADLSDSLVPPLRARDALDRFINGRHERLRDGKPSRDIVRFVVSDATQAFGNELLVQLESTGMPAQPAGHHYRGAATGEGIDHNATLRGGCLDKELC